MSRFDLTSGREEVLPEMNEPRVYFTSILLGKFIYVFGGMGASAKPGVTADSNKRHRHGDLNSCER